MTVHTEINATIEGERIVCQYTKIHSEKLLHTSESHRGKQCIIDDGFCYISKPLRATMYKKKQ